MLLVRWLVLLAGLGLLQVLPPDIREPLVQHNNRAYLLEVSSCQRGSDAASLLPCPARMP